MYQKLSSLIYFILFSEVSVFPPLSAGAMGDSLSLQCVVSGVSNLTSISLHRADKKRVCQVMDGTVTHDVDGITCFGRINATDGNLQVQFASLRCIDDGEYTCEPNPEASTPRKTAINVTSKHSVHKERGEIFHVMLSYNCHTCML